MNNEKFWEPKKTIKQETRKEILTTLANRKYGEEIINPELLPPPELQNTKELIKNNPDLSKEIYEWYKKAIERRDREALGEERFNYHFFEGGSFDETFAFGDRDKGYLLGYKKQGVFIPTHFSPKTMRSGYELIKELGEGYNTPSVMAITEDLVDTISKIPTWHIIDFGFLSKFRDETLKKEFVHNSHPDIDKLLPILVTDFIKENNYDISL